MCANKMQKAESQAIATKHRRDCGSESGDRMARSGHLEWMFFMVDRQPKGNLRRSWRSDYPTWHSVMRDCAKPRVNHLLQSSWYIHIGFRRCLHAGIESRILYLCFSQSIANRVAQRIMYPYSSEARRLHNRESIRAWLNVHHMVVKCPMRFN